MTMRILVLQHIACEPPGAYEEVLLAHGATIERVELDEDEAMPDWRAFDAIIAMGGPMSVNDEAELPWLVEEKRVIAEAVRSGVPYWGVCLGSQLLAASLGARVYRGARPEVGLLPVSLTPEASADPVFREVPVNLLTLQWHSDTFDVPDGGVLLASSSLYRAQAFRWGQLAYGLQFHLEVSSDLAREWAKVPAYARDLETVLGSGSLTRLIEDLERCAPRINDYGKWMFERWLAGVEWFVDGKHDHRERPR
jgi:GMP synthase-like glutamine amidotransferase